MRRFEESQRSDFERYVKLGYDNADCLRQMQSWCKHVEINRVSEGLYAQITGVTHCKPQHRLPIRGRRIAVNEPALDIL